MGRRVYPWIAALGLVCGISLMWHGPSTRLASDKQSPELDGRWAAAQENPTTLVVDFRDDVPPARLADNAYVEEPVSRWSSVDRVYRIRFASAGAAADAARQLAADPDVETVDYDSQLTLPPGEDRAAAVPLSPEVNCSPEAATEERGFPNDPCFRYQWHMRQIGMPDAWKKGNGKGVIVAVIDTGVSVVPDLEGVKMTKGYNFVTDSDDARDDHGHGTHVAGTIAQATHNRLGVVGVAWGATIMPLKVLSARGSGSMAAIAQAIRYAADHDAKVINMSLGGGFPVGAIGNAVKYARGKGVVVIAAAGNDGRGKVSYPARYPGVVAVAATQFDEQTTFYSNWGKEIDIAAPGGNTRVDQNGDGKPDGVLQNTVVPGATDRTDYLWFMGTSMATPHVAGVAALIVGAGVTKPDAVEEILLDTARKPKTVKTTKARVDDHYGAGIADADAALGKARRNRGADELALGGGLALLGLGVLSRRRRLGLVPGAGLAAGALLGSSGLFFLPGMLSAIGVDASGTVVSVLSSGFTGMLAAALGPGWQGNPLLWSAVVPLVLISLLYGAKRARGPIVGFGFGIAGALLFAALAGTIDVRWVPDVLDRAWLTVNAAACAGAAYLVARR